jgi:hypothetical protein
MAEVVGERGGTAFGIR